LTETKPLPFAVEPAPLPGVRVSSSQDILKKDSRLSLLVWAPSGYGKTEFAGGLDDLSRATSGKRTLYIAVEEGEGGGAATLRHRDIPMYTPKDYNELYKTLGLLRNDKSYGGVVLDSASEVAKRHVKREAFKYPSKENSPTRAAGIPVRGDYQVMGEMMSQILRMLIGMTTHEDPAYRKHLIVTATDKTKEEDDKVVYIGPDLPGRMASETVQLFQQCFTMEIKPELVEGKRVNIRHLITSADGVKAAKDRYKILPERIRLKTRAEDPTGEDVLGMWEKYYVPAMRS